MKIIQNNFHAIDKKFSIYLQMNRFQPKRVTSSKTKTLILLCVCGFFLKFHAAIGGYILTERESAQFQKQYQNLCFD